MFRSKYNHTIDAKGRLIIPTKYREILGEEFMLSPGLDGCISAWPLDEWEQFEEKLKALPLNNKKARDLIRSLVGGATNAELDKQGRVLIPNSLRKFAGLDKDVVLVGTLGKVEIWDNERWEKNFEYDDPSSISECMDDLGISF